MLRNGSSFASEVGVGDAELELDVELELDSEGRERREGETSKIFCTRCSICEDG